MIRSARRQEAGHGEPPYERASKLLAEQEQELQRWLRRKKTARALAVQALIVPESASGKSDQAVASAGYRRAPPWASGGSGFLRDSCDGLRDEDVERAVTRALETLPRDATGRSSRSATTRRRRTNSDRSSWTRDAAS